MFRIRRWVGSSGPAYTPTQGTIQESIMSTHFTICPEPGCQAAASIEREEMWPSTDGGVIMAKVIGVCGHWFLMPAWQLDLGHALEGLRRAG